MLPVRLQHDIGGLAALQRPGDLTDDTLENWLFARAGVKQGARRLPEPNWADLALELKKPGVTLMLLWEELLMAVWRRKPRSKVPGPFRLGFPVHQHGLGGVPEAPQS